MTVHLDERCLYYPLSTFGEFSYIKGSVRRGMKIKLSSESD
jgi:hypothetical protein